MRKSTILICILAIGLVGTLYSLPKVVVSKKNGEKGPDSTAAAGAPKAKEDAQAASGAEQHAAAQLTPAQLKEVDALKKGLATADKSGKTATLVSLSDLFFKFQKFDSAAVYAEQAAALDPSAANLMRTGDRYYEAYGFAINESKAKHLGEKTRTYYQKALDQNPNLLLAKANMAMTYVNTENPMQGIMMLREILELDPTNEVALFNMGILSMRSNQYSKAVERFSQIVVHNPGNTKAKFYLGVCLLETGKKEEARKVLAEVKTKEKDPVIQQAIAELEERIQAE